MSLNSLPLCQGPLPLYCIFILRSRSFSEHEFCWVIIQYRGAYLGDCDRIPLIESLVFECSNICASTSDFINKHISRWSGSTKAMTEPYCLAEIAEAAFIAVCCSKSTVESYNWITVCSETPNAARTSTEELSDLTWVTNLLSNCWT